MNIWDSPELEAQRDHRRMVSGRIAFDCFQLKVKGDRAYCAKGHLLGRARDRGLDIVTVLRGVTPSICKTCEDFDGEDY